MTKITACFGFFFLLVMSSCARWHRPLENFADAQSDRIQSKSVYNQADFDFWAAIYFPSFEDIQKLRLAWQEHSSSFPESKAIGDLEKELAKPTQRVMLVALFVTEFEKADLADKSLGWSVSPMPVSISELSDSDVVLRTLMPVKNRWARYFLVRYPSRAWEEGANTVVIGNRTNRIELKLN